MVRSTSNIINYSTYAETPSQYSRREIQSGIRKPLGQVHPRNIATSLLAAPRTTARHWSVLAHLDALNVPLLESASRCSLLRDSVILTSLLAPAEAIDHLYSQSFGTTLVHVPNSLPPNTADHLITTTHVAVTITLSSPGRGVVQPGSHAG